MSSTWTSSAARPPPAVIPAVPWSLADTARRPVRTALDWLADAVLRRQSVQLGLVHASADPWDTASPELPRRSSSPWSAAGAALE